MQRNFNIFTHNPTSETNFNRFWWREGGCPRQKNNWRWCPPPFIRSLGCALWMAWLSSVRPSVQRPSKKVERKRATHDVARLCWPALACSVASNVTWIGPGRPVRCCLYLTWPLPPTCLAQPHFASWLRSMYVITSFVRGGGGGGERR